MSAIALNRITFFPRVKVGHRFLDTGSQFEPRCQFPNTQTMPLGSYSYSLSGFSSCAFIGRYCSIGRGVRVFGNRHPIDRVSTSPIFYRPRRFAKSTGEAPDREMVEFQSPPIPMRIGNDVWIGDDVTLKDGICVGDGAVVAAGSVVTKEVEPYTIVGGNPAKPIRLRFPKEIVSELMKLQWWRYDIHAVQMLPTENAEKFLCQANDLGDSEIVPEQRFRLVDLAE